MEPRHAMPRILLTGKEGRLGSELYRQLSSLGIVVAVGRRECDLSRLDNIRYLVGEAQPDIIVNAAAYTMVDRAESERNAAYAVNASAPEILAQEAAIRNALLIHYSTDYVFDGKKELPYFEDDTPAPLSVYGKSKLAGENAIRASGCRHMIFRTSWMYGTQGNNFLKTVLRLAAEREHLSMVADQIGAPTSVTLVANVSVQILRKYIASCMTLHTDPQDDSRESASMRFGLYHLTASGQTSRHEYARFLVNLGREMEMPLTLQADAIRPIVSSAYPVPAGRPLNSVLSTDKLRTHFGFSLPHWQDGVREVLKHLANS